MIVTGIQGGRGIALEDVLAHVKLDGGAGLRSSGGTLKQARSRFERDYIASVLEQHRGPSPARRPVRSGSTGPIFTGRCGR